MCSWWLIFQLDFSFLALCGAQADTPWFQQGSWAGTTATWRSQAVIVAQLPDQQPPQVPLICTCPQLLIQCSQRQRSLEISVSAFRKMFFVSSIFWLWIWGSYGMGRCTWGSVHLIHFSLCVAAFRQDYLLLSTVIEKGKHVAFCILKFD